MASVSSSAGTDIYYYYDNDHADNTTYIGAIGTTAGENVWDSNFKAVYHMADNTTSTILDSTSNDNDGTKKAANEPIEATGKVGQCQDFDGIDDDIAIGNIMATTDTFSIEAIIYVDTDPGEVNKGIVGHQSWSTGKVGFLYNGKNVSPYGLQADIYGLVPDENFTNKTDFALNTWYYVVFTYDKNGDPSEHKIYYNGILDKTTNCTTNQTAVLDNMDIGDFLNGRYFAGKIDNVRISSNVRTAAWLKATYNTLWDSLLTYGSEETEEEEDNAIFFGFNF